MMAYRDYQTGVTPPSRLPEIVEEDAEDLAE
jgi:hypothetical protein